jgi:predicted acylesterase/phospholipase RssA
VPAREWPACRLPAKSKLSHSFPGIPHARFFSDDPPPILRDQARETTRQSHGAPTILALSGGGSDGAFGAGLLVGWSQLGTRPEFSIVSGVSAGALIAPLAFLGREYDPVLKEILTRGYEAQLSHIRAFPSILLGGLPNARLLRRLVAQLVDDRMIERVAEEHGRGRRLIVVTTNLDAQRTVVWNLGEIAASTHTDRFSIFREVLVASASIPGVFSPVLIDVEANGRYFNEMHVDDGVTRNVFVAPDALIASGTLFQTGCRAGFTSSSTTRSLLISTW